MAVVLVAAAAAIHTTTAVWFALWLGVALAVAEPRWRPALAVGTAAVVMFGVWLLWLGPLSAQPLRVDEPWRSVMTIKDYLFSSDWPLSAWLANLSYPAIMWFGYRTRAARGLTHPRERALVLGRARPHRRVPRLGPDDDGAIRAAGTATGVPRVLDGRGDDGAVSHLVRHGVGRPWAPAGHPPALGHRAGRPPRHRSGACTSWRSNGPSDASFR